MPKRSLLMYSNYLDYWFLIIFFQILIQPFLHVWSHVPNWWALFIWTTFLTFSHHVKTRLQLRSTLIWAPFILLTWSLLSLLSSVFPWLSPPLLLTSFLPHSSRPCSLISSYTVFVSSFSFSIFHSPQTF